jgi:hypothetical protein
MFRNNETLDILLHVSIAIDHAGLMLIYLIVRRAAGCSQQLLSYLERPFLSFVHGLVRVGSNDSIFSLPPASIAIVKLTFVLN